MLVRNIRVLFKFSYPYLLDLREMVTILSNLGYTVSVNLPLLPPGSIALGEIIAVKGNLSLQFNNSIGVISFITKSLDDIPNIREELEAIISNLFLGNLDYIEVSLDAVMNGKFTLTNMLGGEVVGVEVYSKKKNVRVSPYMALKGSYLVIITYKLEKVEELESVVSAIREDIKELEERGLR